MGAPLVQKLLVTASDVLGVVSFIRKRDAALRVLTRRSLQTAVPVLCCQNNLSESPSFLRAAGSTGLLSDAQLQKQRGKRPVQDVYNSVRVARILKKGSLLETKTLIDYIVRCIPCECFAKPTGFQARASVPEVNAGRRTVTQVTKRTTVW